MARKNRFPHFFKENPLEYHFRHTLIKHFETLQYNKRLICIYTYLDCIDVVVSNCLPNG
jgi:hypothetical protein